MNLVNIFNDHREVFLFIRNDDKTLTIERDSSFFPYFFEPHPEGIYRGYDGVSLKKMMVSQPSDIPKMRTNNSYEADILFSKRYIIDKIDSFTPAPLRWCMFDMEIQVPKDAPMPNPRENKCAPYPVSAIVLYDNYEKKYYKFYRPNYKNEMDMLFDFCETIKRLSPDLLMAHNLFGFDFPYLYYRVPNFSERISPINKSRYGDRDFLFPAGISMVDTLDWWKKLTLNKEESYALDALMLKYLGYDKGKYKVMDFSVIDEHVLGRCTGDVEGMVALEEKKQMVPYFDMIRRIGMVEFEDMKWNSRIIDMALLKEARKKKVVLPMKPRDLEDEEFEGAFREAFKTGVFNEVGKYDLSGAYCYAIIDFCLDSVNLMDAPGPDTVSIPVRDRISGEILNTYHVKQDPNTILPAVVNTFVSQKNILKDQMNSLDKTLQAYKEIKIKYDGFKTIVLSTWGVIGNKYFRRYDSRIASMTTGLVRDLLHHVFEELKRMGFEVIYIDTDSAFILDGGKDITELLNGIIAKWAMDNFKKKISIRFDYEGHFEKILILAKCRYRGLRRTSKGLENEVKGIEQKRKDSTVFMKKFQEVLFDKLLDRVPKDEIFDWIKSQIEILKNSPLTSIGHPCKLSKRPDEYKTNNIICRAIKDTPGFTKNVGENFFYIYVQPEYYTEPKTTKSYYREVPGKKEGKTKKEKLTKKKLDELCHDLEINNIDNPNLDSDLDKAGIKNEITTSEVKKARDVMAFDEDHQSHLRPIDWEKAITRNIRKKLVSPFKALGWESDLASFNLNAEDMKDEETEDDGEA